MGLASSRGAGRPGEADQLLLHQVLEQVAGTVGDQLQYEVLSDSHVSRSHPWKKPRK
jgi:hypothetical protein